MIKTFRFSFVLAVAGLSWLPAQVATQANSTYQTEEGREQLARGLDRPGRDTQQKPKELVAAMDLRPGMTVADIGTGAGYMLPFLSAAVGPQGRVLAEDIFQDFLDRACAKAAEDHIANASFVLGTEKDPKLPTGAVDVALSLDSYHHFNYPEDMLAGIRNALRPNGRFVIVEYYRRAGAMGHRSDGFELKHIRLDEDGVIREVEANGFRLLSKRVHNEGSQYMLIFTPR